jgi:divalent metal cation (Fe/Co/Zn/Cd) transporter
MSKQSDIQFYYFPFNLWIDSLIKIFVIISFTFLLVWSINPLYGIIVALILWSFLWNHFYNMINNLYRI